MSDWEGHHRAEETRRGHLWIQYAMAGKEEAVLVLRMTVMRDRVQGKLTIRARHHTSGPL